MRLEIRCASMAGRCSLAQLLLLTSCGFIHCRVDPPRDLAIIDPGHLGYLEIKWSPYTEFIRRNQDQCLVQYELHYYDTYTGSWTIIRTTRTSFSAQFDLAQEVKVRVYTRVSEACADGDSVKNSDYIEVVQKPDRTGIDGFKDLTCAYYNMEQMVCTWKRSSKMPKHVQETLYYWHRDLAKAEECPNYIISDGIRSGCNFSETVLPSFTDVNLCVNASSKNLVKPIYTSLQIQNYVKPKSSAKINVEMGLDRQLRLHWESHAGRIPKHCLEWQVEDSRVRSDGNHTLQQLTSTETAVTLTLPNNETTCLRVRSRLNKYCARSRLWSDWSLPVCYPENKYPVSSHRRYMLPEYVYVAGSVIAALALGLCVWAGFKLRISGRMKKMDPSLCLLGRCAVPEFTLVGQHQLWQQ